MTRHRPASKSISKRVEQMPPGPMVEYMNIEEQVDVDFSRARRRASVRRIGARLRGSGGASDGLLCFGNLRKITGVSGRIYLGMRTVPVGQIGGSVSRCSDFDSDFMPVKASIKDRWKRIDRAFWKGEELPAVSLYKVGGCFYFVPDGHHRVSVARYHGVEWIDAGVTEFRIPSSTYPSEEGIGAIARADYTVRREVRGQLIRAGTGLPHRETSR
jgi:hypothetical protein